MRNVIENVAVKLESSSSGCEIRCDGDGRLWCPSLSLSSSSESLSTAVYTLCPSSSSEEISSLISGVSSSEPVRCNDCDPQVADTYTVDFTDLVSPWITWNTGSHTVHWNDRDPTGILSECMWGSIVRPATSPGLSAITLEWDSATYPNKWSIRLFAYTLTYLDWEGPTDPCDPRGSYGTHTNCSDGASECDSVVATTCTVS